MFRLWSCLGTLVFLLIHILHTAWVRARHCKLQKGCARLAAASDKVYQLGSCLHVVDGALLLLPPLKLVAMI